MGTPKFDKIKEPPDKSGYVVNLYTVEDDDSRLFTSLIQIVADGDLRATLSEASSSSGTKLIGLLRAEAAKALALDYALVTGHRGLHVNDGVLVEVTLDTLNAYYKELNRLQRFCPPAARLSRALS